MKFFRWLNPLPGIRDFASEVSRPNPYRWRIAALALACTIAIFSVMWQEEEVGPPPKPEIIWITSFAPDRTDEEIIASNIANQKRKDELAAAEEVRQARIRQIYKTLGDLSGMDTERIMREGDIERAKEKKAEEERRARLLRQVPAASATAQADRPAGERQE